MAYLQNSFKTQYTGIAVPDSFTTPATDLLRVMEVDPTFNYLNDGSALLYRMLQMYGSDAPSDQPQYWFFEDDQYEIATTVVGNETDTEDDIELTDQIAVPGSVMYVPRTGELIRVETIDAGGMLTNTRGYQGSGAGADQGYALLAGDQIVLVGATLEEGGTANSGIAQLPTKLSNYISFFSQSVEATDLQEVTDMLNGVGQINGEFAKQTLHVMRQMDQALRHSKGYLDTSYAPSAGFGTGTAYYTKGLDEWITTNSELPAVGMTWYDFNDAFNDAFLPTSSSTEKTMIVSQNAYSKINKVAWERWTSNPEFETSLGAMIRTLQLDSGNTIDIVLDKHGFYTDATTQGYLLDMPYVKTKNMANFELNWRDITLPTDHGKKHEVFGSSSVYVKHGADLHRTVSFA